MIWLGVSAALGLAVMVAASMGASDPLLLALAALAYVMGVWGWFH